MRRTQRKGEKNEGKSTAERNGEEFKLNDFRVLASNSRIWEWLSSVLPPSSLSLSLLLSLTERWYFSRGRKWMCIVRFYSTAKMKENWNHAHGVQTTCVPRQQPGVCSTTGYKRRRIEYIIRFHTTCNLWDRFCSGKFYYFLILNFYVVFTVWLVGKKKKEKNIWNV